MNNGIIQDIENLITYLELSDEVRIASFGLYAGYVDDKGIYNKVDNTTRKMLEALPNKSSIIIGLPELWPCKPNCPECIAKHKAMLARIDFTIAEFPNIEWTKTTEWHAKWYLVKSITGTPVGFTGGHNLTASGWFDISVRMSDQAAKTAWDLHARRVIEEHDAKIGNLEDWIPQEDR